MTNRYFYHTNQLGYVIALTNSTGALVQIYSYDSFGRAYVSNSGTLTPLDTYSGSIYSNTRLYTGREYDKETNLYYLRARYYNASTGKFISRDPVGQNDQVNLYTYVKNSPLMYTDRDGKRVKQAIASGWNGYLNGSQRFGSYMYDNISNINKDDVVGYLENVRNYGGYASLASIPFFFFPATIPVGVGIATGAGGTSLVAGATETAITGKLKPLMIEAGGALVGPSIGWAGKYVGVLSKVEFSTKAMRYMGEYGENAYGFVATQISRAGYGISKSVEQVTGFMAGQVAN